MTGKEKGLVCSSLFLQWSSGDLQDCIRQQGLVTEWLCRFHLETMHPRQNLFVVPQSSRDPIVLALGKMFVKQIWNCNVVRQYCCTLKDQRSAGLVVDYESWHLHLSLIYPELLSFLVGGVEVQQCQGETATLCSFLCISSPDYTHLAGRRQILHQCNPATTWACKNKPN